MFVYILYEHDLLVEAWTPTIHSIYLNKTDAEKEMERLSEKGEYGYSISKERVIE